MIGLLEQPDSYDVVTDHNLHLSGVPTLVNNTTTGNLQHTISSIKPCSPIQVQDFINQYFLLNS